MSLIDVQTCCLLTKFLVLNAEHVTHMNSVDLRVLILIPAVNKENSDRESHSPAADHDLYIHTVFHV